MTTIEELERELEQFHKNIACSNKLIETIDAVIAAIKSQEQDISERSDALTKLIETLPATIEEKNTATINEFEHEISEAFSKDHKLYIDNIEKYIQALEDVKGNILKQQEIFVEKLDGTTSSFSKECIAYSETLVKIKSELAQETTSTMNAITAENSKICEKYLAQVKSVCNETKEKFADYTLKFEQLTTQFSEIEKKTRDIIINVEQSIDNIIDDSVKSYREISASISKSVEHLLLEIKVYIEYLEKQNESLVKNIEEKFNNSFKSIQNENSQILEKLNQIQTSQNKGKLLAGIGFAVLSILCVVGFFL